MDAKSTPAKALADGYGNNMQDIMHAVSPTKTVCLEWSWRGVAFFAALITFFNITGIARSDDKPPLGRSITIVSPLGDILSEHVKRVASDLNKRALEENRKAVLVLEITPGLSTPFGKVLDLAKFLTTQIPHVTTVAWVPESVQGNHVVLAIACREIVMARGAELGDISLGKALDTDERLAIINIVNRRHNIRVYEAVAIGLMDPDKELIWVQFEAQAGKGVESRVVLPEEYERLKNGRLVISKYETIKSVGTPGMFTGERAMSYGILAMQTAENRTELAKLYNLPPGAMNEAPLDDKPPKSIRIHIDEPITTLVEQFVTRQIDRAVAQGYTLIIFDIESPGGQLLASINLCDSITALGDRKIRTVAYVPKQAISGAAMIALSCDEIYAAPSAVIGDIIPLEMKAGGWAEHAPAKILSILKVKLRDIAHKKGRSGALAEAMADKDLVVYQATDAKTGDIEFLTESEIHAAAGQWVKGPAVPESEGNSALTVTGRRAHDLRLAEEPVPAFEGLKQKLGIPPETAVPAAQRTWVDTLIFVLNTNQMTAVLIILGVLLLYLEVHFQVGLFGILSGVSFSLFFWSRFLGGTAGWLEVILFLLGVGCLAMEIFVMPGFGVFGVSGILLVLSSLVMASQTFVMPASGTDLNLLGQNVATITVSFVAVCCLAVVLSRFLPRIPMFEGIVLSAPGADTHGPIIDPKLLAPRTPHRESLLQRDIELVGKTGITLTLLRPAGKAEIDGAYIDVVSDGTFVPAGRTVKVVSIEGSIVMVREVESA